MRLIPVLAALLVVSACKNEEEEASGVGLLGNGSHDASGLTLTVVAGKSDGLSKPRDLEFHPDNAGQLWVLSKKNHSMLIIDDADSGEGGSRVHHQDDQSGTHFMAKPVAFAFGKTGTLATIHEEDKETQGPVANGGTPADFMGPTLWPSDVSQFNAGHSSHLDMLHNTPNGMGIAWKKGNAYFVFDGFHESITYYDFKEDHGLGGADHSGATTTRYAEGEVKRVSDVPSHLWYDDEGEVLYIADTGNNRIAVFQVTGNTTGDEIGPNYDQVEQSYGMDYTLDTLVQGSDFGMQQPSGLEFHDGMLWVTDSATSRIHAFDFDGTEVDYVDLGLPPGSLGGIAFDDSGNLYYADGQADEVVRISL